MGQIERDSPAGPVASLRAQLAVAFLALLLIGANDGGLGVLLPSIGAQYQVTTTILGTLFIAVTAGYAMVAFSAGILADMLGLRRLLLLGAGCFVVAELLVSSMPPFAVVVLAFLVLGSGIACLDIGLNTYLAGLPRSTALLNNLHAFYGTGALLGPIVASGILAVGRPWRAVYVVWALAGFALGASLVAAYRGRLHADVGLSRGRGGERRALTAFVRMPVLWMGSIFLVIYVGAEVSMGSWSYTFLTEARHGQPLLMGWVVSGYWASFTLGRFTAARLADALNEARLIQVCLVGATIGLSLMWLLPSSGGAAVGLFLTGVSFGPIYPTTIALLPKLVPSQVLAGVIGVVASVGSVGGAIFPWLAGVLLHSVGLRILPPYAITLAVIMLTLSTLLKTKASRGRD